MNATIQQNPSVEHLLGDVATDFFARLAAGESPSVEEYAGKYPVIAEQIRLTFPALELVGESLPSGNGSPGGHAQSPKLGDKQIGDYVIGREIGRGGMGVVYEAQQISLNRQVALKVLPFAGALDHRQLQRFKMEAQAAALLHHQNIVPVFGIGADRGVHFYAMQLIEGQTLAEVITKLLSPIAPPIVAPHSSETKAINTRPLAGGSDAGAADPPSGRVIPETREVDTKRTALAAHSTEHSINSSAFIRSVAELGIQAADALDHAHGEGVIHRDIKPSNLILDVPGKLWVTDFGLALVEANPGLTMTGDLVGTLRYMSPEQARGKRVLVDQRTDIYSLCATLYELLTLRPVFGGEDRQELIKQISLEDPVRPRKLNRTIPTELDIILLKGLEKNPEDRYATAAQLADDLRRLLDDRPILAKPPSLLQRTAKLARRNKPLVTAAGILFVFATLGLSISNVLISRERNDKQVALTDLTVALREKERALELADDNLYRVLRVMDEFYLSMKVEDAVLREPKITEETRQLLTRLIDVYQELATRNDASEIVQFEMGKAQNRIGVIYDSLGERSNAEKAYERAVEILTPLTQKFPGKLEYNGPIGEAYFNLGAMRVYRYDREKAKQYIRKAIGLLEPLEREHPELDQSRETLARSWIMLGDCGEDREACYRNAIGVGDRLAAEFPDVPAYSRGIGYGNLGLLLIQDNRIQEAEERFQKKLHLCDKFDARFPNELSILKARSLVNRYIAFLHVKRGDEDKAEQALRAALDDLRTICHLFPGDNTLVSRYRVSCMRLIDLFKRQGRDDEIDETINGWFEILPANAFTYFQRGYVLENSLQRIDEALIDFEQSIRLNPSYPQPYLRTAWIYEARGEYQNALDKFAELIAVDQMNHNAFTYRARVRWKIKDFRGAVSDYIEAASMNDGLDRLHSAAWFSSIAPDTSARQPNHAFDLASRLVSHAPENGLYRATLGMAQYRAEHYESSIETLRAVLESEITYETGDYGGYAAMFLSMAYQKNGKHDAARQRYKNTLLRLKDNADEDLMPIIAEASELIGLAI